MADAQVTFGTAVDPMGLQKGIGNMDATFNRMSKVVQTVAGVMNETFGPKQQAKIDTLAAKYQKQTNAIAQQQAKLSALDAKYKELAEKEAPSLAKMRDESEKVTLDLQKMSIEHDKLLAKSEKYEGLKVVTPEQENEMYRVGAQIESLEYKMQKAQGRFYDLGAAMKQIEMNPAASAEAEKLQAEIDKTKAKLNDTVGAAEQTAAAMKRAADPGPAMQAAAAWRSWGEILRDVRVATGDAIASVAKFSGGLASGMSKGAAIGAKGLRKLFSTIGKGVATGAKGLTGLISRMNIFHRDTNKASGGISSLTKRIGKMVAAAFTFNVIRRALRQLTEYIGGLISSNAQLSTSMAKIKGNLQSAFAPIWNAALPALQTLANFLVTVTGYIAQFVNALASMFGWSTAAGSALNNQAKATGGAGKAAEKASKQLAKFDDINQQTAETASDGGAGGLGAIFEDTKTELAGWMQDILDAIEAGDWFRVGQIVAEKINEAVASIDWAGIGTKVGLFLQNAFLLAFGFLSTMNTGQIGTGIATMFMNIIRNLDPVLVGNTIASFWNRVVDFFSGIVTTIKWDEVGAWLSGVFKGFFSLFNLLKLVGAISTFVNGIFLAIKTFFAGIDWTEVGTTLGNAINGLFTGFDTETISLAVSGFVNSLITFIGTTMSTIDFAAIGSSLAKWFNDSISGIDWTKLGETISTAILGLITFLSTAVIETDWKALGDSLWTAIKAIDWADVFDKLGKLLGGLIEGLANLLTAPFEALGTWIADQIKALFGIEGPLLEKPTQRSPASGGGWVEEGKQIPEGITKGVEEKKDEPKDALIAMSKEDQKALRGEWDIQSPSGVTEGYAEDIMDGFGVGFESGKDAVLAAFVGFMDSIDGNVATILANITEGFSTAWTTIQTAWEGAGAWFSTTVINPVQTAFDTSLTSIRDYFDTAWINIKNTWGLAKKWFDDTVINPTKTAFDTALTSIKGYFDTAWTGVKTAWGDAPTWFQTNVIDKILVAFGTLTEGIRSVLNGVLGLVNSAIDKLQTGINGIVSTINSMGFTIGPVTVKVNGVSQTVMDKTTVKPSGLSAINLSSYKIPMLAQGGLIPPNHPRTVIVGDNTREPEIVSPVSTMEDAVFSALEKFSFGREGFMGGGSARPIEITLMVNEFELGRVVVPAYDNEKKRQGFRVNLAGVPT